MAMHDIIHNAPSDPLQTILTRQKDIGGVDLAGMPKDETIFSDPFSAERVMFIQDFYSYVCEAKPGGFKLTWSDWMTQKITQDKSVATSA